MLPAGCFPCPPVIRHIAHHVARRFRHPVRRILHHAMRHPGKIVVAACCAGTLGPGAGTLPVAPPNAPSAVYAAPLPASAGWPEMPGWSVASGPAFGGGVFGSGATGGNAPVFIPVYERAPAPQLLATQPVVSPANTPPTHIPEPASLALLLLPMGALAVARRSRT